MKPTKEELKAMLKAHAWWLTTKGTNSEQGERFKCFGDKFIDANMRGADLRYAIFFASDLIGADLQYAILRGASFNLSDLSGAKLVSADLRGVNLVNAKLRNTNFQGADLRGANLREADLRGADLRFTDLRGADLTGANLLDADLRVHYASPAVSDALAAVFAAQMALLKTSFEHDEENEMGVAE